MLIAWTTVATRAAADDLAASAVTAGLAACTQVDGPVTAHYTWEGKVEKAEEFRLCFKVVDDRAAALEAFVLARHPYEVPEWVVVRAERVAEKYLSWAAAPRSSGPL